MFHHHSIRNSSILAVALCLILLSGCGMGSTEFRPLRVGDIPWPNGEITLYQVTDSEGEDAGQMRITLAEIDGESRLMRREIGGAFRENLEITMKANNLRPVESNLSRTHLDGEESIVAAYDGSKVRMEYTTKLDVTTSEQVSIPSDSYDYRSIMILLRTLPLEGGYATRVNGFLPISGALERMELIVNRTETVDVPAGSYESWKVLMNTRSNRSQAWISKQAPYLLVKYEDGSNGATFELQSFEIQSVDE